MYLLFVSFSKLKTKQKNHSFTQKWRKISSRDASRADSLARLIRRVDVIIIIIIIINGW